jgi:hypothetical protein
LKGFDAINVIRAIGLSVILLLINDCPAFGGYPYSYNDCPQCGNCCPDKWNFCINNCTSYVAYKLNYIFHDDQIVFNYWYKDKGVHWGDAGNWKSDIPTTWGPDPCFLRYKNLGAGSVELFIQEDASADPEMNHVKENVSILLRSKDLAWVISTKGGHAIRITNDFRKPT